MQLSTNSNAAIIQEIRAQPTHAGQYRAAYVHRRDRQMALESFDVERRKLDVEIKKAKAELKELSYNLADNSIPSYQRTIHELRIEELEIAIEEFEQRKKNDSELVADAIRELKVCESEMSRIISESNIQFQLMPEHEFQALMTQNNREINARYIAAECIGPMIGIPAHTAMLLLELPEDERDEAMSKAIALFNKIPVPVLPEASVEVVE